MAPSPLFTGCCLLAPSVLHDHKHLTCRAHGAADADGALEAFVSVITGPPGDRPEALMDRIKGPMLILWGALCPGTLVTIWSSYLEGKQLMPLQENVELCVS